MTASLNSINSYHNHIKGKVENSQNKMVLDYIRVAGPCSIRVLHKFIKENGNDEEKTIELVSLRRSVHNLTYPTKKGIFINEWGKAKLRVLKNDKCPITGQTVGIYDAITKHEQLNLF